PSPIASSARVSHGVSDTAPAIAATPARRTRAFLRLGMTAFPPSRRCETAAGASAENSAAPRPWQGGVARHAKPKEATRTDDSAPSQTRGAMLSAAKLTPATV